MLQDTTFQRQSQVENILAGDQDDDAKRRLLTALGYSKEAIDDLLNEAETSRGAGAAATRLREESAQRRELGTAPGGNYAVPSVEELRSYGLLPPATSE
jgi:hypothetical protein